MELINAHPLAAAIAIGPVPDAPQQRFLMLTVKATFTVAASGALTIDREHPLPLLGADTPTPLGDLPRDDLPRCDEVFEVLLYGHGVSAQPVTTHAVSLRVGDTQRQLRISGDRAWERGFFGQRIGNAAPFTRMPLIWGNAFGGRAEVEIDRDAFVEVCEVANPMGKGFDHEAEAKAVATSLRSPKGYPRCDVPRLLPNIEDPAHLITRPADHPQPVCWAAVPMTSAIHGMRMLLAPGDPRPGPGLLHRAHPQWVLPQPPQPGARVELLGATAGGRWAFSLPKVQVAADVLANGTTQQVSARAQMLQLFPDESRCCVLYRGFARIGIPDGEPRRARLTWQMEQA